MKKLPIIIGFCLCLCLLLPLTVCAAEEDVWYVKLTDGMTGSSMLSSSVEEQYQLGESIFGYYAVSEEQAKELDGRPFVDEVGISGVSHLCEGESELAAAPNDPMYASQWALDYLNWENSRYITTGSSNVTIAVIDSGYYIDREDSGNIVAGGDYSSGHYTALGAPDSTHGTAVAGILGAATNNGVGIAGATSNCKIVIYQVFKNGTASNLYIAEAIKAAVDNGADIINMSFGSYDSGDAMETAVAYASDKGVLMVAAAGNDGASSNKKDSRYQYPASYNNVISVGAIDSDNQCCNFSQHNNKLDIMAPGRNILSFDRDSDYNNNTGTSFATPYITALAALALSVDSSLTSPEFEKLLHDNAVDLGEPGYDKYYGYGSVDYYSVLADLANVNQELNHTEMHVTTTADLVIPGTVNGYNDNVRRVLTVTAYNQDGAVFQGAQNTEWTILDSKDMTGIYLNGNVLIVTNAAVEQTLTLQAVTTDDSGHSTTTTGSIQLVKRSQYVDLTLDQISFPLPTLAENNVSHTLTCTATDQYGNTATLSGSDLSWNIYPDRNDVSGITLDVTTGVLTLNSHARVNKAFQIELTWDGDKPVRAIANVTLTTEEADWTATIRGNSNLLPGTTSTYNAVAVDQYGNEEDGSAFVWSLTGAKSVTINQEGVLTVGADAPKQTLMIHAVNNAYGEASYAVTIAKGSSQTTTTDFGVITMQDNVAQVTVDTQYAVNTLAKGEDLTLNIQNISAQDYKIALAGDIFNSMYTENGSLTVATALGTVTLPANSKFDILGYEDTLAGSNYSLILRIESAPVGALGYGGYYAGNAVRITMLLNNSNEITSDELMIDLKLPVTDSYTTLVRIANEKTALSVPTDQSNPQHAVGTARGFGTYAPVGRHIAFDDVSPTFWGYTTIMDMASRFIINGITNTTFAPNEKITRAQFCTLIVNALTLEPTAGENIFADVETDAWYTPYINAAYNAKLVEGMGDGNFGPNNSITREQAITIMIRACAYTKRPATQMSNQDITTALAAFYDSNSISRWARTTTAQAVHDGLINGYDDKTLRPFNDLSRAEGATLLRNMLIATDMINDNTK